MDPAGALVCLHNPQARGLSTRARTLADAQRRARPRPTLAQDNSILGVNMRERTVFAVSLAQFSNYKSSLMLTDLAAEGVLGERPCPRTGRRWLTPLRAQFFSRTTRRRLSCSTCARTSWSP